MPPAVPFVFRRNFQFQSCQNGQTHTSRVRFQIWMHEHIKNDYRIFENTHNWCKQSMYQRMKFIRPMIDTPNDVRVHFVPNSLGSDVDFKEPLDRCSPHKFNRIAKGYAHTTSTSKWRWERWSCTRHMHQQIYQFSRKKKKPGHYINKRRTD